MPSRESFVSWPSFEAGGMSFVVADTPARKGQGLAGVSSQEWGEKLMLFENILTCPRDGTPCFNNLDNGYGHVSFDLDIAFLDEGGKIMQISFMEKETGRALPIDGFKYAVEARTGLFKEKGLGVGDVFPGWDEISNRNI